MFRGVLLLPALAVFLAATAVACGETTLYPYAPVEVKVPCPPTMLAGFAAVADTDGGVAGPTNGGNDSPELPVTVKDVEALKAELQSSAPRVILLDGMLTVTDAPLRVTLDRDVRNGNKTLVGIGANSGLTGAGIDLSYSDNVILRNLKISKAAIGEGDAITLLDAHHIWIDHCDLSSDRDDTISGYDGLIDITHGSSYITVSWTVFHDHRNTSLVGHSADPTQEIEDSALRVTYHHNLFSRVYSGPRVRWGIAHVANNLFSDVNGFGVVSESKALVWLDKNVFNDDVIVPIATMYQDDTPGTMVESLNRFPRTFAIDIMRPTTAPQPLPYSYSPDSAESVSTLVSSCAGTGKLEN